jgi:hypothetical protein
MSESEDDPQMLDEHNSQSSVMSLNLTDELPESQSLFTVASERRAVSTSTPKTKKFIHRR